MIPYNEQKSSNSLLFLEGELPFAVAKVSGVVLGWHQLVYHGNSPLASMSYGGNKVCVIHGLYQSTQGGKAL